MSRRVDGRKEQREGEQRESKGDCVLCVYMGLCGLADIKLGPEEGQALANFLQGNNTLRSLHLSSMPREEGERRDVRGLLCVGAFLVFVVRGRAVVAAEGEGRREECEAAARCGGVCRGAEEQAKGQGGG